MFPLGNGAKKYFEFNRDGDGGWGGRIMFLLKLSFVMKKSSFYCLYIFYFLIRFKFGSAQVFRTSLSEQPATEPTTSRFSQLRSSHQPTTHTY